jgi:hypothetical protein
VYTAAASEPQRITAMRTFENVVSRPMEMPATEPRFTYPSGF